MISLLQSFIPRPRLLSDSGPAAQASSQSGVPCHAAPLPTAQELYRQLLRTHRPESTQVAARAFLDARLKAVTNLPCALPEDPEQLERWAAAEVAQTGTHYQAYLARRKAGSPREYFHSRSHALATLRALAPTKLVDGAWLSGMLARAGDLRFGELVRTYLEELGDGSPDKNHVLLYRRLLQTHGIDDWMNQPDRCFEQGAIQLALGACTDDFLPEAIGFNLGYEQLPLHLLITAYELDELGIDPYYFTLHVTVDNAASGHGMRAVKAVHDAMRGTEDPSRFWARVRRGFQLNDIGDGTLSAISNFALHAELLRVLDQKTVEGSFAHSNHCRLEGRTVNEWLGAPEGAEGFVKALQRKGWLARGADPRSVRFWQLLHGERAPMFGVFGAYERQVIFDWIRGDDSADGAAAPASNDIAAGPVPCKAFRQQLRMAPALETGLRQCIQLAPLTAQSELAAFSARLESAAGSAPRLELLREMMGPDLHWTNEGLYATRIFRRALFGSDGAAVEAR